jgi:hypothetical protein
LPLPCGASPGNYCPAGIMKPAFPLSHTILRFVLHVSCLPRFVFAYQLEFYFCNVMHINLYHDIYLYVYVVVCACSVLTPNARV